MRAGLFQIKDGKLDLQGNLYQGKLQDAEGKEKTEFESSDDFFEHLFTALGGEKGIIELIKNNSDAVLSIIFSFPGQPIESEGNLDYQVAQELTKGFKIPELSNNQFTPLLNKYFKNKQISLLKTALFNDTPILGEIGLVVGTGYNFAIKMKISNLRKFLGENFASGWSDDEWMMVNLEAGDMGVSSKYADENNQNSIFYCVNKKTDKPDNSRDEKLISGKYLAMALEVILENFKKISKGKAVKWKRTFENWLRGKKPPEIKSEYISAILADKWEDLPFEVNMDYRDSLKKACELLRDRSVDLVAGMIRGSLGLIGEKKLTITVEGSPFWLMPGYKEEFMEYMNSLKDNSQGGYDIKVFSYEEENAKIRSLYNGAIAGLQYFDDLEKKRK